MPLPSSIDLIYGQSSVTGITSTGFVLKILPAGVEIFSANIVYVKNPELTSSNRIGRFGAGMSQNIEEAGNREERRKYANERSPIYWFYEPGEKNIPGVHLADLSA